MGNTQTMSSLKALLCHLEEHPDDVPSCKSDTTRLLQELLRIRATIPRNADGDLVLLGSKHWCHTIWGWKPVTVGHVGTEEAFIDRVAWINTRKLHTNRPPEAEVDDA